MKNGSEITKILEMLAENEEAVGLLYTTYANLFPNKRAFWLELASEEAHHANMLRSLLNTALPLHVKIPMSDVRDMLKVSCKYIADKQEQAEKGKLKMKEAVTTALEIETSMLERGNFEFLRGGPVELSNVSEALTSDTRKHSERIRDELQRKRWFFF